MPEEFTPGTGEFQQEIKYNSDQEPGDIFGDIRRSLEAGKLSYYDLSGEQLETLIPKALSWLKTHGKPSFENVENLKIAIRKGGGDEVQAKVNFGIKIPAMSVNVDSTLINSKDKPGEIEVAEIQAKGKGLGFIPVNLDEQAKEYIGGTKLGDYLRDFLKSGINEGLEGKYEDVVIGFELTDDEKLRVSFRNTSPAVGIALPPEPLETPTSALPVEVQLTQSVNVGEEKEEGVQIEPGYDKSYQVLHKDSGDITGYERVIWNGGKVVVYIYDEKAELEQSFGLNTTDSKEVQGFIQDQVFHDKDFEVIPTDRELELPKEDKEEAVISDESTKPTEVEDEKTRAWNIILQQLKDKEEKALADKKREAEMGDAWDAVGRASEAAEKAASQHKQIEELGPEKLWERLSSVLDQKIARLEDQRLKAGSPEQEDKILQEIARFQKAGPLNLLGVFPEEEVEKSEILTGEVIEALKQPEVSGTQQQPEIIDLQVTDVVEKSPEELAEAVPPIPESAPIVPPEPEKPKVKPQDLRSGSTWYEHVRVTDPDSGKSVDYLFHYNSKEKLLVQEEVDETGIVSTNPDATQEIKVKSRGKAIEKIGNILDRLKKEDPKFKNAEFERNIPIYEEEKTPEELAGTLVTELVGEEKGEREKKKETVLQDFENQAARVAENLQEALSEYELAQRKVSEEIPTRKTVVGPSLEEKRQNYERLFDLALHDYELAYRNMNNFFEAKIKGYPIGNDDPDLQRFRELGNEAGERYRSALKEDLSPEEAVEKMKEYSEVIEQRLSVYKVFDDKYGEKPEPTEAREVAAEPEQTKAPPEEAKVSTTKQVEKPPARDLGAIRPSTRERLQQLRTVGFRPSPQPQPAEVRLEVPLVRPAIEQLQPLESVVSPPPAQEIKVEGLSQKRQEEGEWPKKSPVERFLEKNPEYKRVVKENRDGRKPTYSFYNIALNRQEGGLIVYYFTLINDHEYKTHTPIIIADPNQLEEKLKEHLDSSKDKFRWTSYEYNVDLTPELEETLKKAKRIFGSKRKI